MSRNVSTGLLQPRSPSNIGLIRARVVNNHDPKKLGRVQIRIFNIHSTEESGGVKDENLPWAFPCSLDASYDSGTMIIPETDMTVWVLFEDNDPEKPVYLGGCYGSGVDREERNVGVKGKKTRTQKFNDREVPHEWNDPDTKVVYKSPKGAAIIIEDNDGHEELVIKDQLGQVIQIRSPMKSEYTEEFRHKTTRDIRSKVFDDWDELEGPAEILIKSLSGSTIKMTSSRSSSSVTINNDNSTFTANPNSIKLSVGGYVFELGSGGITTNAPIQTSSNINAAGSIFAGTANSNKHSH